VRDVLGKLKREQAGLILLRAEGFSYTEIGAVLNLKTTSVGTLLARAEERVRAIGLAHAALADQGEDLIGAEAVAFKERHGMGSVKLISIWIPLSAADCSRRRRCSPAWDSSLVRGSA